MRFAILPLVIHRESQFVPAGNDVLIEAGSVGINLRKAKFKMMISDV
jgi:hypothetical protein